MPESPLIRRRGVSVSYSGTDTVTIAMTSESWRRGRQVHVEQLHCRHVPLADWQEDAAECLGRALRLLQAEFAPQR